MTLEEVDRWRMSSVIRREDRLVRLLVHVDEELGGAGPKRLPRRVVA
jgi:hypothetical protein